MRHTVCNTKSHPKMSWWDILIGRHYVLMRHMSWWDIQYAIPNRIPRCSDETYSMQYQISSQDVLMRHTVCNTKSHPKMSWWDIQYAIPMSPRFPDETFPDETYSMQYQISSQDVLMRHTVCNTKSHPKMSWWDIQYATLNVIPRFPDETCPDETYSMQYQISSQDVLMRHTVCNTKSHPKMSWWDIQYAIPNLIPRCPDETYSMQH